MMTIIGLEGSLKSLISLFFLQFKMTELRPTSLGGGYDLLNKDLADIRARNRGVSSLWTNVNHIAITVADVGRSLAFYTDIVGMKQVIRPNFDR